MHAEKNSEKVPLLAPSATADGEQPQKYETSPRRWIVLLSVASIFLTQGLVITAFAPVAI